MSRAKNILNFLLPSNHANAGKTFKMPDVYVTNTSTGETSNIGGNEYTYITNEEPKRTNTMINTNTTSSDVNNAINEYYDRLDATNAQQLAWAKEQAAQQQENFRTELQLKQQERADTLLENATTRQREDTYYQRMMADLAAAGINPLMAGQLSGAGVKMGMVANGNINTPGAVGLNLSAPQSQAGVAAQEANSLRDAQFNYAKLEADSATADKQLEFAKEELYNSNIREDKKIEAEKAIEWARECNNLLLEKMKADSQAEENEADRKLKWQIETYSAIKKAVASTGIKVLDTLIEDAIDAITPENWREWDVTKSIEKLGKGIKDVTNKVSEAFQNENKENIERINKGGPVNEPKGYKPKTSDIKTDENGRKYYNVRKGGAIHKVYIN